MGLALILTCSASSWAIAEPLKPDISGSVTAMSDYRFRGYSRSDGDPAVQVSAEVTTQVEERTRIFIGASASGFVRSGPYGSIETSPYAGLERELGAFHVEIGGRGYLFPDAHDRDYYELFSAGRFDLGPVSTRVGVAFAPRQTNIGDRRGLYLYSDLESGIPRTPLTALVHLGWEDNGQARDKLDWELKLLYVRNPWNLGIGYVDTNRFIPSGNQGIRSPNRAGATLIVSAGATF